MELFGSTSVEEHFNSLEEFDNHTGFIYDVTKDGRQWFQKTIIVEPLKKHWGKIAASMRERPAPVGSKFGPAKTPPTLGDTAITTCAWNLEPSA